MGNARTVSMFEREKRNKETDFLEAECTKVGGFGGEVFSGVFALAI